MLTIKQVLYATDFSDSAKAALPIACALARNYEARLILLHVRPAPASVAGEFGGIVPGPGEPDESVKSRLTQMLPADFTGRVECRVGDGDAAEEIVAVADRTGCDLIVLGTHGRTGLARLLVGSVAEAVLRTATCPVLTVKPPTPKATTERAQSETVEPELTTVCSVANPAEAAIIRNTLAAEGIRCFVQGAQQGGFAGTIGFPIDLQVRTRDADRAKKLIRRSSIKSY
jgi:nucleotide-binding universal stress UspA family protein